MTKILIPIKQITTNQVVQNTIKKKDRREDKGRVLALSRRMYRLRQNIDTFYVESESSDDHYYFVKFKPDVFLESWYCSCKDNSIREMKCKHIFAIEFAIQWGTLKDIDKLPITTTEADIKEDTIQVAPISKSSSSYKDDDYSF